MGLCLIKMFACCSKNAHFHCCQVDIPIGVKKANTHTEEEEAAFKHRCFNMRVEKTASLKFGWRDSANRSSLPAKQPRAWLHLRGGNSLFATEGADWPECNVSKSNEGTKQGETSNP